MTGKPNYTKARTSVRVPVQAVSDVLAQIADLGHSRKFGEHMEQQGATVTLPKETVNLLKDYVAANNLHAASPMLAALVKEDPTNNPNSCDFKPK